MSEELEGQWIKEFGVLDTDILVLNIRAINPEWYLGPKVEKYIRLTAVYLGGTYLNKYLAARKKAQNEIQKRDKLLERLIHLMEHGNPKGYKYKELLDEYEELNG